MHGEAASPGSLYSRKRCTKAPQGHPPAACLLPPISHRYSQHLFPTTSTFLPSPARRLLLPLFAPKRRERESRGVCETASRTPAIAHTYLYTVIFKMRERARASGQRFAIYRTSAIPNRRGRRRAEMGKSPPSPSPSAPRTVHPRFVFFFRRYCCRAICVSGRGTTLLQVFDKVGNPLRFPSSLDVRVYTCGDGARGHTSIGDK